MKIVRTKRYTKDLKRIGATDRQIAALESIIAADPTCGDVIPGLDGVRKVRFALKNKRKRSGGRAIYFLVMGGGAIVMVAAYAKNEKEDITSDDKKAILAVKEAFDGEPN